MTMDRFTTREEEEAVRKAGLDNGHNDTGPDIAHWADVDAEGNNIFDQFLETIGVAEPGTLHPDATDALWSIYVEAYRVGDKLRQAVSL